MSTVKESKADRIFNFINYLILTIIFLIVLYPLIFVVSASVSDPDLVNQGKVWLLPKGLNFDGFRRVFQDKNIWTGYKNTVFYTIVGTVINLIATLPAAYALSRKDLMGRHIITAFFTFTMFFSGGLIPTYLLMKSLGIRDTIWAMLIPGAVGMWNVIISRTYFQNNIPLELQESAQIDGCSDIRLLFTIVLPLSKPIIAVVGLFYAVGHWNSYFSALIYLKDRALYPLQLFLREILIMNEISAEMMTTGEDLELMARQARVAELIKYSVIIVSTVPVLCIYPFIQKYFVKGMMVGAIKG